MASNHGNKPQLSDVPASKKRKLVHHTLRHDTPNLPQHVELVIQDPVFAQGQLLRSIAAGLALAGFDSVQSSALEMFRAHAEEYMLSFLSQVRASMTTSRRTTPTALDFAASLAHTSSPASQLQPHLRVPVREDLAFPPVPTLREPLPPQSPPDFSSLLRPLMTDRPPAYIPQHFPALPPKHSWKATADLPSRRETDARKMREKATEEGTLAEQALRKLAAAAKAGALKVERKRSGHTSTVPTPHGTRLGGQRAALRARQKVDTFEDVLKDIGEEGAVDAAVDRLDAGMKEALADEGMDLGMPEGVIVNHDMAHWRRGRHRLGLSGFV